MDYDTAKSRLFVRLINYDKNTDILRNVVYKTFGDIAFTVYAIVDENEFGIVSTKILKFMVKNGVKMRMIFSMKLLKTLII